jgi:hypothetical protein
MTLITHPSMPGSAVDVPDSSLPFHQAAGWVIKGSEDDPEVKAAAEAAKGKDGGDAAGQDETPKSRRAGKKDGED